MHWEVHNVFSVISGALLLFGAIALPGVPARTRFWCLAGGLLMGGYGFYAASQPSGVFVFSRYIFGVPILALLYLFMGTRERQSRARIKPLPAGSTPARRCVRCAQLYPTDTTGACPACGGSLVAGG